jgi:hypothetical protein
MSPELFNDMVPGNAILGGRVVALICAHPCRSVSLEHVYVTFGVVPLDCNVAAMKV